MDASRPPAPPRLVVSVAMSTVGKRAAASASARASASRPRCSASEACGRSSMTSSFGRDPWARAAARQGQTKVHSQSGNNREMQVNTKCPVRLRDSVGVDDGCICEHVADAAVEHDMPAE